MPLQEAYERYKLPFDLLYKKSNLKVKMCYQASPMLV